MNNLLDTLRQQEKDGIVDLESRNHKDVGLAFLTKSTMTSHQIPRLNAQVMAVLEYQGGFQARMEQFLKKPKVAAIARETLHRV